MWVTTKVYFREKLISQVCQLKPNYFLVAEYSRPGYWLIDRRQPEEDKPPVKIEDERAEHNSGCTDLQILPMYEETKFPYVVSRNKFKIDIIDLVDKYIFTLCEESNTSAMTQKMSIATSRQPTGHSIEIYFACQIADRRGVRCLSIEPKIVTKMQHVPEEDYFQ